MKLYIVYFVEPLFVTEHLNVAMQFAQTLADRLYGEYETQGDNQINFFPIKENRPPDWDRNAAIYVRPLVLEDQSRLSEAIEYVDRKKEVTTWWNQIKAKHAK